MLFANYTVYLLTLLQNYAILFTHVYRPDSPPLHAHPHIRAHARILIRIAHTQLHVYMHAFNIYKGVLNTSNKKYAPNEQCV